MLPFNSSQIHSFQCTIVRTCVHLLTISLCSCGQAGCLLLQECLGLHHEVILVLKLLHSLLGVLQILGLLPVALHLGLQPLALGSLRLQRLHLVAEQLVRVKLLKQFTFLHQT